MSTSASMTELLLTPSYFSCGYGDILCASHNFSNPVAYCARSVAPPGPIRNAAISAVRHLLATISAAPMTTTLEDFHKLAILCLCRSHVSIAPLIAMEWKEVVRNALQQYRLSSGPSPNLMVTNSDVQRLQSPNRAPVTQPSFEEARLREETLSWKKKYESLDHETIANKIKSFEAKVSSLEDSSQRDQREISAQRLSLLEVKTAKTKLEADVQQSANQLEALRLNHDGVQVLKEKLQQSTAQNQTLQAERIKTNDRIESLQEDLRNLQTKVDDLKKSNELMAIELATKDQALRGEETRVNELMKVVVNLEVSEARLKQVIASCWLHRIYNWLTGSRLVF